MKRTDITYGQLDTVLRSLGFSLRMSKKDPPSRVYEHESGALFTTPPYPMTDLAYAHHLAAARSILDQFDIADPKIFDAKLQKAG
jgi:hypothetical protein